MACIDSPDVKSLVESIKDRKVITYGLSETANVYGYNLRPQDTGYVFDVRITLDKDKEPTVFKNITLPLFGAHNVLNALGAITCSAKIGLDMNKVIRNLGEFSGVKRRFTEVGNVNGVRVVDDYAHHPREIKAVLMAARQNVGPSKQIIAIMQPHRYTRLKNSFDEFCSCFSEANHIFITPVYSAGEEPIPNYNSLTLVNTLKENGYDSAFFSEDMEQLPSHIINISRPGDLVICLGAGNISSWTHELPGKLKSFSQEGAA